MSTLRGNREILRVEDVSVTLGAGRRRGMSTGNRVLQRVNLTIRTEWCGQDNPAARVR